MKNLGHAVILLTVLFFLNAFAVAGTDASSVSTSRVIQYSAILHADDGVSYYNQGDISEPVTLTFSVYRTNDDTDPIWHETQTLQLFRDVMGAKYSVFLGSTTQGLPNDVFSREQSLWIGVKNGDKPEMPRVALTAHPFALMTQDSMRLGGRPASDYALASDVGPGLSDALNTETSRSQQAEAALAQNLSTEVSARENAVSALETAQQTTSSQISALSAAIVILQSQISILQASNAALSVPVAPPIVPVAAQPDVNVPAPTETGTSVAPTSRATRTARLAPNVQ